MLMTQQQIVKNYHITFQTDSRYQNDFFHRKQEVWKEKSMKVTSQNLILMEKTDKILGEVQQNRPYLMSKITKYSNKKVMRISMLSYAKQIFLCKESYSQGLIKLQCYEQNKHDINQNMAAQRSESLNIKGISNNNTQTAIQNLIKNQSQQSNRRVLPIITRHFSRKMMFDDTQDIMDDEFLPQQEDYEIQQAIKDDSSMLVSTKPDSRLRHNIEFEGEIYKYDLPVENKALQLKTALIVVEEEEEPTATQNLYERLAIEASTSYESYIIKANQEYNNEVDMYGDIQEVGLASNPVLQFGTPIPFKIVRDEVIMKKIRYVAKFNQDMPGSIENIHPNKFITSKPNNSRPSSY